MFFTKEHKERAELIAQSIKGSEKVNSVKKCPVCGAESLVEKYDYEEDYELDNREYFKVWTNSICSCCSFEVSHPIKNPSEYGLDIIDFESEFE